MRAARRVAAARLSARTPLCVIAEITERTGINPFSAGCLSDARGHRRRAGSPTDSWQDYRTSRRRRVPRTAPPRRASQLDRLAEQLHPPQVAKKPAHTLPQRISTHRSNRAHQPDQQTEHHIVAAGHDRLVRTDQHRIIGKPPTKLPQLPQKSLPAHTNTHALPSLPRSTGRTPHDQTITIAPLPARLCSP
ncbi:hypothetical protein RERY_38420 [Rhodococcus erythropolis]|jgi:hypothetical protein|nr:hypothetical protein [Rhodococcus erythropolis]OFV75538.1 hypothetical protein RERY_38420 [Rhodococcus erythropolis]